MGFFVKKKIVVLGTGGTIAGQAASASDNLGYTAGTLSINSLLAMVPLELSFDHQIEAEQLVQLDSKDMSFSVLRILALRVSALLSQSDVVGIVITHGTDTLEETAFFLDQVCDPRKPVVLTCAMRPSTSFAPDGPQNLLDALAVAGCADASGVLVVCAGRIHSAVHVQKNHTYRLDAFSSGEAGCTGFVEEGRVRFLQNPLLALVEHACTATKKIADNFLELDWPRVELVINAVGVDGRMVDAVVAHGVDGIVVAGTGNGTIHHQLEAALLRAQSQGVEVVVATRCMEGRVLHVASRPFADSAGLSPVKARIAMILRLLAVGD